jgi:hypothetical protein
MKIKKENKDARKENRIEMDEGYVYIEGLWLGEVHRSPVRTILITRLDFIA